MKEQDLNHEPTRHRYLSAPWRMRYLNDSSPRPDCVFCDKLNAGDDIDNLVLWRGDSIAAIMNLYPYATGHLMLVPYAHVASPEQLDDAAIMTEIALEVPQMMRALRRVLGCEGFNIGMNTGGAAGAGIAGHMHLHIVPRWSGDANFMAVVADVTVMPELLAVTYAKLRAESTIEHNPAQTIDTLVLSADRTRVLTPSEPIVENQHSASDRDSSVVSRLGSTFAHMGIQTQIAGWVGDKTIVFLANPESNRVTDRWTDVDMLPATMKALATEAIDRLSDR